MAENPKRTWLSRLRERRQARRERTLERARQRTAHERDLERQGKVGGSSDIGGAGIG